MVVLPGRSVRAMFFLDADFSRFTDYCVFEHKVESKLSWVYPDIWHAGSS